MSIDMGFDTSAALRSMPPPSPDWDGKPAKPYAVLCDWATVYLTTYKAAWHYAVHETRRRCLIAEWTGEGWCERHRVI